MALAGISGRGIVSALGRNLPETRHALFAPALPVPAPSRRIQTTLPLPVFELDWVETSPCPGGITMHLLQHALEEALAEADLTPEDLATARVGTAVGTTVACQLNDIPFYAKLRADAVDDLSPVQRWLQGNPAEAIRRQFRLNGPAVTVSNACASGADAVGIVLLWLQNGLCDIAIAAGADEINQVPLDGFHALGVCSREPCRPFDAHRTGLNLGEGAAVVILESHEHAAKRQHAQTFRAAGFGKTADAFHITQPEPSGTQLERAIQICLAQAGKTVADVEFVNAHGTGTLVNDKTEGQTLARIFGPTLRYQSTKALTGHTLGAAGTIEFLLTQLMLEQRLALPSFQCQEPDPELPVPPLRDFLPIPGDFALSTSLAFGGSNTALAIARFPEDTK